MTAFQFQHNSSGRLASKRMKARTGSRSPSFDRRMSSQRVPIETHDDHRMAMSFAVLGTKLGNLHIEDPELCRKILSRILGRSGNVEIGLKLPPLRGARARPRHQTTGWAVKAKTMGYLRQPLGPLLRTGP